jgi:hypothetical protein
MPVEFSRTPPMGESTVQDSAISTEDVMVAAELSKDHVAAGPPNWLGSSSEN